MSVRSGSIGSDMSCPACGSTGSAGGLETDRSCSAGACIECSICCGFCLEAGAIMGHVPPEGRGRLRGYARDIGLAFPIVDALRDVELGRAACRGRVWQDV